MAIGQASAIDRDQQQVSVDLEQQRRLRLHELWDWLLTNRKGRQFLWDVMLADTGYDRPLGLHHPQATVLYEQAALHNLALHWMNTRVRARPDLYRQMLAEAAARDAEQEKTEAARRTPARDEERE